MLSGYTSRLGICGNTGLITGAISGGLLTVLYFRQGMHLLLTETEVLNVSLILTVFCWLVIIFILCMLVRLTFRSVAVPALINTFLVCYVTTFLSNYFHAFEYAWLIGIVVGIMIGTVLCKIASLLNLKSKDT